MPPNQPDRDGLPHEPEAIRWSKSSHSNYNGNCVETARLPSGQWVVRDTKDRDGAMLIFGSGGWGSFINGIKHSEFDF
jgi:hypothetical protein